MRSKLYQPVSRLVQSVAGSATAFLWAFAEALFWPILPDYYLFAVGPAALGRWWRLALFATAGSVAGGSIGYWISHVRESAFPLQVAPLITEGMIATAASWIADQGAGAVLRQPLSGIPYKVFVYLSGEIRLPFAAFLLASLAARAIRIFAAAGLGAALGRIAGPERTARYYDLFLVLYTLVFAYGLWRVVKSF